MTLGPIIFLSDTYWKLKCSHTIEEDQTLQIFKIFDYKLMHIYGVSIFTDTHSGQSCYQ